MMKDTMIKPLPADDAPILRFGDSGAGAITFTTIGDGEVLKLDSDGNIYVHGRLAENDKAAVDALREFLRSSGHLR